MIQEIEGEISFLEELGVDDLPTGEQDKVKLNFIQLFLERLFAKLGEKLNNEKQEDFINLIDENIELEKIFDFLEKEVEGFSGFLEEEINNFKKEILEILN